MKCNELILGIDGGGTTTSAWLASCVPSEAPQVVAKAVAGPTNPQAVGFDAALANLDAAVDAAFELVDITSGPVRAAVAALAGSDRDENRRAFNEWAERRHLAERFDIVTDAQPLLAAGTPDGWGVALIAGTGSICFGQTRDGQTARAGGWGHLFGDEGSGYAIALAGLRAAAQAADGRGPHTSLIQAFTDRLSVASATELVSAVYPMAADRAAIASLSDVVTSLAEDDDVAGRIVEQAAEALAAMVLAIARRLGLVGERFPLALAGGVLLGSERLGEALMERLAADFITAAPVARVEKPVWGAVILAERLAELGSESGQ